MNEQQEPFTFHVLSECSDQAACPIHPAVPPKLPPRCLLCKNRPDDCPLMHELPPPLLSADMRHPARICDCCHEKLLAMMLDVPWIRYQMSQYVIPRNRPGYSPNGWYFGEKPE